ncbi:hypothetical protein ABL78_3673 [Leptomonas seymouri]|uniref:Uncharacterized protein n=1 Tax=Leptomonas seymouri TaxID=5684 RepID=A0A0N0P654_LEPSE|nr:hypothetical protein ABL78_3673 [Leptomonas seymouri]|eukprot:KPI87236.1 hypothetical protein ABL78_3673 [Leptomonas seymouri]
MIRTVPAYSQPQMDTVHAVVGPVQQQQMHSAVDMTAPRGFPAPMSDNCSIVYLMSPMPSDPATIPPQSWMHAKGVPMLTTTATSANPSRPTLAQIRSPVSTTTATTASASHSLQPPRPAPSDLRWSTPMWAECSAPSSGDKLADTASSLLHGVALSVNDVSATLTNASDVSTVSNASSANGKPSPTAAGSFFVGTAPPLSPLQTPQGCFWLDSGNGTLKAMTAEEVAAAVATSMASHNAAVSAYAMSPPPLSATTATARMMLPDSMASATACSVASAPSFRAPVGPSFAAAVPGGVPYIPIMAMPPSLPPAPKTMNGLQYEYGEVYDGVVKRYNPNRGFGFLTATHHIKMDGASPADALTAAKSSHHCATSTEPAVMGRRIPVQLGDIFVHQSYMHMQGFRILPVGGRVRFRVGYKDGQQTFQAVDVQLLPQVIPQSIEAPATCVTSPNPMIASPLPADRVLNEMSVPGAKQVLCVSTPQNLANTADDWINSPVGGVSHSEAEQFFSGAKDKGLICSPLTLTPGASVNGEDEDDSPLIELAYEVYRSLEE